MKKSILLTFLLVLVSAQFKLYAVCNWKSNIKNFAAVVVDSCPNKHFYGGVSLSNTKGITYKWKIGSAVVGTASNINYTPTANGTYTLCLQLVDSINKCDTTLCVSGLWYNCYKPCNWKNRYPKFEVWDTCRGKGGTNNLNGSMNFNNSTSCYKYSWTINSASVSNSKTMKYNFTGNGTYNICVKVTDTCNKCDTTFCATKTMTCFSTPCNWKKITTNFYTWDTCKGNGNANSINGYIAFNVKGCFKYAWTVNSSPAGDNYINHYKITKNGTYTYCLKVTDTCNKCDTTFCATKTISCFSAPCNWKGRYPKFEVWDTCRGKGGTNNLNGSMNFNNSTSCYRYSWTINSASVSNSKMMKYNFTGNGTYNICVKVTDTCNKCDTTFCVTKTMTCFSTPCNWKSRFPTFTAWDTCNGSGKRNSVNAYISFNSSRSCFKYAWTVNNVLVSTSNYYITKPIFNNGTYNICVKVTDTCNKCDTTFCTTRTISCFSTPCNWKKITTNFYTWDTCRGNGGVNNINGYIAFNVKGCFKYAWTVNGNPTGDNSVNRYKITKNGTYTYCVKVTDTCNKCDTTFCSTRTISCFTNICKWYLRQPTMKVWDTCKGSGYRNSVNGYVTFAKSGNCYKYAWTVNGVAAGNKYIMNRLIERNGTYDICVKITDTCDNCDTTICKSVTISCFKTCKWYLRKPTMGVWDSCKANGARNNYINSYISFNNNGNCNKYKWYVNGALVYTGKDYIIHKEIKQSGTYNICVNILDTCDKCDTTICKSINVTCIKSCNWNGKNLQLTAWDTCKGNGYRNSVNGYIAPNNNPCYKYAWTVNGVAAGNAYIMSKTITKNGTYNICVTVRDTCNKCDTTYCTTRKITCFKSPCNWANRYPTFYAYDTCLSSNIYGYIGFNYSRSCFKYSWSVNNTNVNGNNYYLKYPIKQNGTYTICVNVMDTCNKCDTTFCNTITVNCNSLKVSTLSNNKVKVYPNPANSLLNIEWETPENCTYELVNMFGSEILSGTLEQGTNMINTSSLPSAMYMLKIHTIDGTKTLKVIINR